MNRNPMIEDMGFDDRYGDGYDDRHDDRQDELMIDMLIDMVIKVTPRLPEPRRNKVLFPSSWDDE